MSVRLFCLLVLSLTLYINLSTGVVIDKEKNDFAREAGEGRAKLRESDGGKKANLTSDGNHVQNLNLKVKSGGPDELLETTEYSVTTGTSKDSEKENVNTTPSTENKQPTSENISSADVALDRVNKLSDQIRLVLAQYRQEGVVVLPGQTFLPDPMPMDDYQSSSTLATVDFKNMRVYGLSNYTVEQINTDLDIMQVFILLRMKRILVLGNYSMSAAWLRSVGRFNVTLLDVEAEGVAQIEINPEGHLEATDSRVDIIVGAKKLHFSNIGIVHQGMISGSEDALFDKMKSQTLERFNLVIRNDINNKLKNLAVKFIDKITPVDLAFSEGRKYVREHGYDQLKLEDQHFDMWGLVYINITQFRVEGLSRFHRVGNLSLSMDGGIIEVGVHVSTGKLTGEFMWSGKGLSISKSGKLNFTVDHLQVRAVVTQSLDVTKQPNLNQLDLEVGKVNVTLNSTMVLSTVVEGVINAAPRLIRHVIVDTLEKPLKETLQGILNQTNMETAVEENLTRLDSLGL